MVIGTASPNSDCVRGTATIKENGESIMATKITTALVAALVAGALMTSNHEALARGGGGHGGGFGGGGFHGGGCGARLLEWTY
jgi:uncharacterized membrane protein YgcG